MNGARILVVEDEGIEALDLQQRLENLGYTMTGVVSDGEEAVRKAQDTAPDLVLMDIMLQGEMDGITAAEKIRASCDIPVIYTTAYADEETLLRAKVTEPYGYIIKPLRERELYITINIALYKHKMERKIRESEKWFAITLKSIGDAVIATDKKGMITFMNRVAEELLGWKQEEVRNRKLTEVFRLINVHTRKPEENPVDRVLQDGCSFGLANHALLISRNGEEIPIDDSAAPIIDDLGNITGVVLVFRDVTDRFRNEQALRESEERYQVLAEKLRETDSRKNEFMAVLSHELRNPLAAIHISLSVFERTAPDSEQAKRAIEIIKRQVGQLSRLVDDLLDITRITRNKIKLQLERVELNELIRQTLEDSRSLFEQNGVFLEADLVPQPIILNADKSRLVQVIGNMLHNAAKFTGKGGKTRVSVENDVFRRHVVIRVLDTGIGIEPETLSRIFEPFMQADTTLDRSGGGLGLGLALCKGLVELHGGLMTAYSAGKGKGSEFTVILPLEEGSIMKTQSSSQGIICRKRRILIVDDNVDMVESLRELLHFYGHEVGVSYNGRDGIAKAKEYRPEILLCDIGLPHLNGYEVARAVRSDKDLKDMFLVAITGYALPEDLRQIAEAGFDYHLPKPVDLHELKKILAEQPRGNKNA